MKYLVCVAAILIIFAASLGLTGCGGNDDEGVVVIRLQIHWPIESDRGQAIRAICDKFEETYPDIQVKLLKGEGDSHSLLAQVASASPPDLIETAYYNVKVLAQNNLLEPMDMLTSTREEFYPAIWKQCMHKGRLVAYPWFGHTIQLIYNADRFRKYKINKPPKTWQELYETAKLLTRDTDGDGKPDEFGLSLAGKQGTDLAWLFTMFLHQGGAKLLEEKGGSWHVALNSPEGLNALKTYLKLIREVCPPGVATKAGGDVMSDFRSGRVAMEFQGPWGVTDIWSQPEEKRFTVRVALAPAGPGGWAMEMGANMTVVPKRARNPEYATKLAAFLAGKEAQTMLMDGPEGVDNFVPFRVPVRQHMVDIPFFSKHPEFVPFLKGFTHPSIEVPIPIWVRIRDEVYAPLLNRAILGDITPEDALAEIERRGNHILNPLEE
jgi:multiple sugar transport system substrate-binding protein